MAEFHFFTDIDLLNIQTSSQAYGPIGSADGKDRYRVTSLHTASGGPKAFACMDGIIAVQAITNEANLVNIILKPIDHPNVNFAPIKYFIYKGILKSSLISSDGTEIAPKATSDLTNSLWESQERRNKSIDKALGNPSGSTKEKPSNKALGIHFTSSSPIPDQVLDSDYVEKLFYRKGDYQLPIVRAGWHIGDFFSTGFGFEIVLDTISYEPTLHSCRLLENIISVDVLPTSAYDEEKFDHWHEKEKVLHYMDPSAFLGSHYLDKVKGKDSGNKVTKRRDEIYEDIIIKFYNKNRVYLDIRNEHNHYYNYSFNYNNEFKIGIDEGIPAITPYTINGGWPICILEKNVFSNSVLNSGEIKINLSKGDNDLPAIYLLQGYFEESYPKQRTKLKEVEFVNNYTDNVILTLPKAGSNIIANYIQLRYLKGIVQQPAISTTPALFTMPAQYFIDNLFFVNNLIKNNKLTIPWNTDDPTKWYTTKELVFVDSSSGYKNAYMAKVGVAEDAESVYFFCSSAGDELKRSDLGLDLGSDTSTLNSFLEVITQKFSSIYFGREDLMIANNKTSIINTSLPDAKWDSSVLYATGEDLVIVAITKNEFTNLLLLVDQLHTKYDKCLVIRNRITEADDNETPYLKGEIWLSGYSKTSPLKVIEINTNIIYYQEI